MFGGRWLLESDRSLAATGLRICPRIICPSTRDLRVPLQWQGRFRKLLENGENKTGCLRGTRNGLPLNDLFDLLTINQRGSDLGGWGRGEVTLFAGSFGGTVESCCLCLGLWSPLSTCALQGAGALATAPLLFLLVSTKLLLSEDCRTSVIKNKTESCFTHPTPKSTWKSVCTGMGGHTAPPLPLTPTS